MMPKPQIDEPVLQSSISKKKEFIPVCPSGLPSSQELRDAKPVELKCFDCGGCRVFGVGRASKAKYGFLGRRFYFCLACGEWLKEENRPKDNELIAERKQSDPEFAAAVEAGLRRAAAHKK